PLPWLGGALATVLSLQASVPQWFSAGADFPILTGYLLYGAIIGATLDSLSGAYALAHPRPGGPRTTGRRSAPVVILGGRLGGIKAAQRLERLLAHDETVEITLISQSNSMVFTPMLAEVASSSLAARDVTAPVRAALRRTQFWQAKVEGIDTRAQVVQL